MSNWFWHGLRNGIPTTRFPLAPEPAVGAMPALPRLSTFGGSEEANRAAALCPTGALAPDDAQVHVDLGRCIACQRCRAPAIPAMHWREPEPAALLRVSPLPQTLPRAFARSLHVIVVDAGDCGACLNEVRQLNNPYYNCHRLGIFFTATPRLADVLLVVGPGTANMRAALDKTYAAMPAPKRVLAVGTCALSGGVFGRNFACAGGIGDLLPADAEVMGDPPPPLAILAGLLQLGGRA